MRTKQQLLWALQILRKDGPSLRDLGICYHVRSMCCDIDVENLMGELFRRWPEFSGEPAYPVPSPDRRTPSFAYNHAVDETIWAHNHPYGASRWRLVDYMINELENDPDLAECG